MRSGLVALLLPLALGACAHPHVESAAQGVAPLSYAPLPTKLERSVGLLRRVAFLPVRLQASPEDPRWCGGPCDPAGYARALRHASARMLADWRGYEIKRVRGAGDLAALAEWAGASGPGDPPEPLREQVQRIGRGAGCDAVVFVHGRLVYLTWLDAAAWLATLGLAIPISMARVGTSLEADLFEVRSGRLVWKSSLRAGGDPDTRESRADLLGQMLFDPLELALPGVLAVEPAAQ